MTAPDGIDVPSWVYNDPQSRWKSAARVAITYFYRFAYSEEFVANDDAPRRQVDHRGPSDKPEGTLWMDEVKRSISLQTTTRGVSVSNKP